MKKIFNFMLMTTIVAMAASCKPKVVVPQNEAVLPQSDSTFGVVSNLDHDIYVYGVSEIVNTSYTGFDVTVGPTGWPVGSSLKWEVALYEDTNYYYSRLILHEYMLWWSWDEPYLAVKFPKANVPGDLRTNEKLRNDVLWTFTHETYRSYDYAPYVNSKVIQNINGHTVSFGDYACKYEKYLVISDAQHSW